MFFLRSNSGNTKQELKLFVHLAFLSLSLCFTLIDLSGGLQRLSATQLSLMMSCCWWPWNGATASASAGEVEGGWHKLQSHFKKTNCGI